MYTGMNCRSYYRLSSWNVTLVWLKVVLEQHCVSPDIQMLWYDIISFTPESRTLHSVRFVFTRHDASPTDIKLHIDTCWTSFKDSWPPLFWSSIIHLEKGKRKLRVHSSIGSVAPYEKSNQYAIERRTRSRHWGSKRADIRGWASICGNLSAVNGVQSLQTS